MWDLFLPDAAHEGTNSQYSALLLDVRHRDFEP